MSNSRLNAYFETVHSTLRSQMTREQRHLSALSVAGWRGWHQSAPAPAPPRPWRGRRALASTSMEVFIRPLHTWGTPEWQQTQATHEPEGTVGVVGQSAGWVPDSADPRRQPSDYAGATVPEPCSHL